MYTIRTTYTFNASHALIYVDGTREDAHDHRWRVDVVVTSPKLDESGCVVDFVQLDKGMHEILAPLKGRCLNDLPAFTGRSVSAEVVAEMLFHEVETLLDAGDARVESVSAWEDERHEATYRRAP